MHFVLQFQIDQIHVHLQRQFEITGTILASKNFLAFLRTQVDHLAIGKAFTTLGNKHKSYLPVELKRQNSGITYGFSKFVFA